MLLIRHGQYNLDGETDKERILTELGREQAKATGVRLKELQVPINTFVISTMTRAQETGKIILSQLEDVSKFEIKNDSLIEEGAPVPPEPKVGHWRPQPAVCDEALIILYFMNIFFFSKLFSSSSSTDQESRPVSVSIFIELIPHKKMTPIQFLSAMQTSSAILFVELCSYSPKHGSVFHFITLVLHGSRFIQVEESFSECSAIAVICRKNL